VKSGLLHDVFAGDERIGEINAEAARKVVVADSGHTERACFAGQRAVSRSLFESDGDDRVDHVSHCRRAKPEMAMPPIADHRKHARLCQLREMGAGGLRRDSRRQGELARGQRTAIEKRRRYRSSRRVSDQRRDLGDDRACNHFRYLTHESGRRTLARW
jgi:hypothetical protein